MNESILWHLSYNLRGLILDTSYNSKSNLFFYIPEWSWVEYGVLFIAIAIATARALTSYRDVCMYNTLYSVLTFIVVSPARREKACGFPCDCDRCRSYPYLLLPSTYPYATMYVCRHFISALYLYILGRAIYLVTEPSPNTAILYSAGETWSGWALPFTRTDTLGGHRCYKKSISNSILIQHRKITKPSPKSLLISSTIVL